MHRLAQSVWSQHPALMNTGASVGELAWTWGAGQRDAAAWRSKLWFDGDRSLAWGRISPAEMIRLGDDRWELNATTLDWQVHPDHSHLFEEVLDWFDGEAGGADRRLSVRVADRHSIEMLARHGYVLDHGAPWFELNRCTLGELAAP